MDVEPSPLSLLVALLLTIVTVDIGWLAAAVEGAPVMDVEELIGVVHSRDVKVGVACGRGQAVCSRCGCGLPSHVQRWWAWSICL